MKTETRLTDDQIDIIGSLTREDAVRLLEANEVGTWKAICCALQNFARSGGVVPINALRFYSALRWDFDTRRYVLKPPYPGYPKSS